MGFSEEEIEELTELIKDNYESLFPDSKTKAANNVSDKAWDVLASAFNRKFPNNPKRADQLRTKWKNLKSTAKSDYAKSKK